MVSSGRRYLARAACRRARALHTNLQREVAASLYNSDQTLSAKQQVLQTTLQTHSGTVASQLSTTEATATTNAAAVLDSKVRRNMRPKHWKVDNTKAYSKALDIIGPSRFLERGRDRLQTQSGIRSGRGLVFIRYAGPIVNVRMNFDHMNASWWNVIPAVDDVNDHDNMMIYPDWPHRDWMVSPGSTVRRIKTKVNHGYDHNVLICIIISPTW